MPHRFAALDVAVRESTRLVTLSFDTGLALSTSDDPDVFSGGAVYLTL